jgi:hypothetical protein
VSSGLNLSFDTAALLANFHRMNAFLKILLLSFCISSVSHGQAPDGSGTLANIARQADISLVDSKLPVKSVDVSKYTSPQAKPLLLSPSQTLYIQWPHPRDVREIQLRLGGGNAQAQDLKIEWWHRIWPDNGKGGWMQLDDPFNGAWTRASCVSSNSGSLLSLRMQPLSTNEVRGLQESGQLFRRTYKLRITASKPVSLSFLGVFTDAVERKARLRFEWGLHSSATFKPEFEVRNGRLMHSSPESKNAAVLDLAYADSPDRLSADRGYVVFRNGETGSFSVFIDDVLREGGIHVRDVDVFASDASKNLRFASWPGPAGPVWTNGIVTAQVPQMPEQSLERAMSAFPVKPPVHCFLGVPNLRQEIALSPVGDIQMFVDSLRTASTDTSRRPWPWDSLIFFFDSRTKPDAPYKRQYEVRRTLEEGWLPVVRHQWTNEGIEVLQSSVACPLKESIKGFQSKNGLEPLALVSRFEFKNPAGSRQTASLWLTLNRPVAWRMTVDGALVMDAASDGKRYPGMVPVRGRFDIRGKGKLEFVPLPGGEDDSRPELRGEATYNPVRYQIELEPNGTHAIEFAVSYIELLDGEELLALKHLSYDRVHRETVEYWKARIARGMTFEVPDPYLNDFFKASLWHVLISTDMDPSTGDAQHGAATHVYKNFLNETAMVARSLEMRGEHAEAIRLLEPFLANQGVKGLPGNFKSKDGVLYAAYSREPDPYTAQGYNMHHGFGMWALAEHYSWTRDAAWLGARADKLAKAAEWLIRERQQTRFKNAEGVRPIEFGLAPAGDLEDVSEYLYFYATDAYFYLGLKKTADALAEIRHPAAKRLQSEAKSFLEDIQASVAESIATSPAVRLNDGSYIPFVPHRAYALTHLKEGWIREGLYPAIHLLNAGVYPATHPFANWMIDELEDNVFLSAECGFGVKNPESAFFDFGGFTLQPNLLDLSLAYLKRDQIALFLRAFYNAGAASLYPDIACFAEWIPAIGHGGGPLYKTPDESKFIQWMRSMLILETDNGLELGLGVPKAWMEDGKTIKIERAATFYGPLAMTIASQSNSNQAEAQIQLAQTLPPKSIAIRLRHPQGLPLQSAQANGKPAPIDRARQLIQLPVGTNSWSVTATFGK